ncbi:MAG: PAS domain S-box protein [Acidobacteriota bacterium]|nr:PAS domain S-box protein [Acidobacteriota bacterium]
MFRTLCQAAFDGVMVHDAGRIVTVNEQCARMFGARPEAMVGRSVFDMVNTEKHQAVRQRIRDQDSRAVEFIGQRADGSKVHLEGCGVTIDGSSLRLVAIRDLTERRKGEQELRRREERFSALVHTAFEGLVIENESGIVEVNASFEQTFGYTSDELRGRRLAELIAGEPEDEAPSGTTPRDACVLRKDGSSLIVQLCTAVTSDGERISALHDVTRERQAQMEVAESERRYRELSESTHDLLCVHDEDGRIIDVNPAAARALGYTSEELCSLNMMQLLTPRAAAGFAEYIDTVTRDGRAEGIMSLRTRQGALRLWNFHNTLRTSGGRTTVRGQARDVTDRETALHDLRESEHHFRTIIENVSDLITLIDPTGVIRYVSPSVTRALGIAVEDLTDRSYAELVHPGDAAEAGTVFMRQLTTPEAVGALDARIQHGDGTWRWYSIVVTNRLVDGKVANVILNARDITERRLLLSQLEQANRVNGLGRLAATVAHEFNNVLMGMQPFAELIQRPKITAEMAARGAGYIASSIARGKRVALDILRFTQPAQPALERVVLRKWWDQLLPEVQAGTENSIQLEWTMPQDLAVIADESQLCQVFSNLLSNARHALSGGGSLAVTARRPAKGETFPFGIVASPESYVQISVSDTGSGIPPEIIENVFDPLFTTKRNGGTGLGLAVVHQIVTNHGGVIFVESTPDRGTTFHVFLRAAEEQEIDDAREPLSVPQVARPARILIVDDEVAVAEGLADVLGEEGHTTAIAGTSAEGELLAERFMPDFALVDVGLPDANGAELAVRLRGGHPDLRVVIISGHADASGVLPDDSKIRFLQKPFPSKALLQILEALESEKSR